MENKQKDKISLEGGVRDLYDYVNLRITEAKLSSTEHLSVLFSSIFGLLLAMIFFGIAMLFMAAAAVIWIGSLIGYIWATIIIMAIFMGAAAIVFFKRKQLIVNSMIKVFLELFFDIGRKNDTNEQI